MVVCCVPRDSIGTSWLSLEWYSRTLHISFTLLSSSFLSLMTLHQPSTLGSHFTSPLGFLFGSRILRASGELPPPQISAPHIRQPLMHPGSYCPQGSLVHTMQSPAVQPCHLTLPLVLPGLVLNLA